MCWKQESTTCSCPQTAYSPPGGGESCSAEYSPFAYGHGRFCWPDRWPWCTQGLLHTFMLKMILGDTMIVVYLIYSKSIWSDQEIEAGIVHKYSHPSTARFSPKNLPRTLQISHETMSGGGHFQRSDRTGMTSNTLICRDSLVPKLPAAAIHPYIDCIQSFIVWKVRQPERGLEASLVPTEGGSDHKLKIS